MLRRTRSSTGHWLNLVRGDHCCRAAPEALYMWLYLSIPDCILCYLSIDGTQMAIWWVATSGFGRYLYGRGPKWQTRIGFPIFNSDDFGPGPLKWFNSFRLLGIPRCSGFLEPTLLWWVTRLDEVPGASPSRDIFSTKLSLKRDSAGGGCVYSVTWHLPEDQKSWFTTPHPLFVTCRFQAWYSFPQYLLIPATELSGDWRVHSMLRSVGKEEKTIPSCNDISSPMIAPPVLQQSAFCALKKNRLAEARSFPVFGFRPLKCSESEYWITAGKPVRTDGIARN
jgi:hypothetical protein